MKKFEKISFSLIDYEGGLKKFKRDGNGTQYWGDFCSLQGQWVEDQLTNEAKLKFNHFPSEMILQIKNCRINQCKMEIGDMILDIQFDKDWKIQSGIIEIKEGMGAIHFTTNDKILESYDLYRNNIPIDLQKVKKGEKIYRIYSNELQTRFLELNLDTQSITYYQNNESEQINGKIPQISFKKQMFFLYTFQKGQMIGLQQGLNLFADIPYSSQIYINYEKAIDKYYYLNGGILVKESDSSQAKLSFLNNNSYIVGHFKDDFIDGDCKLIINGQKEVVTEFKNKYMLIKDPAQFLNGLQDLINQTPSEINKTKINGYNNYQYKNGITYRGFFQNDFIHCHKDALMTSLEGFDNTRKFDLEQFLLKIKNFEGRIVEGKVIGEVKVEYIDGSIYHGHLNINFMKNGEGLLLKRSKGVELYYGNFKNDQYHGIGKIFKDNNEFILGYFENGELLLKFDIDNLETNIYESIRNQLAKDLEFIDGELLQAIFKELKEKDPQFQTHEEKELKEILKIKENQKKKEEENILEDLTALKVVKTVYHFANGYAFHGLVKGQYILDDSEGTIMKHSTNENFSVNYKYISSIDSGSFKSQDGKSLFLFKYKDRRIAQILLDQEEQNTQEEKDRTELLQRIKEQVKQNEEDSEDIEDLVDKNVFMGNGSELSFQNK